jgi:hypothetical protein
MNINDITLWILAIIGGTATLVFVAVSIIAITNLLGLVRLPPELASRLHSALIIEIVVIAVGAFGALVSPNAIKTLTEAATLAGSKQAAPASVPSEVGTKVDVAPIPVTIAGPLNLACAASDGPPLVYIQFATEAQRGAATKLQSDLLAAEINAPGIELAPKYTRQETQLRFFHTEEKTDAAQLLSLVQAVVGGTVTLRQVAMDARKCQFEVWIGTGG